LIVGKLADAIYEGRHGDIEDIEYEVSAEDAEAYIEDEAIITGDEEEVA
jgi:small subunit ribosomal protein S2